MKKKIWIAAAAVLMLLYCTGCGKKTEPVSKDMVMENVQSMGEFAALGLTVDNVTIDEQKTDVENKIDQIFVTVEASNEEVACVAKYALNYFLYDQGWSLESVTERNTHEWTYKPMKGVAPEIPDKKVKGLYVGNLNLSDVKEDLENGSCVYIYTDRTEMKNCINTRVIELRYIYNYKRGGWKFDSNEVVEDRKTDWDIVGTWSAVAASDSWAASGWSEGIVVTVKNVTEDTAEMSIHHPEVGVFFDGTVPFDLDSGIEFPVDDETMGCPDYFTVVVGPDSARLLGVGMRPDEFLSRQ